MPEVSVIIPLFGRHRGAEALPLVCDAWLGQDVPCEVIVAVAGSPHALPVREALRVVRTDMADPAPGLLRNVGAAQARSAMLYLSDADVLPLGRDFLRRVIRLAAGRVVAQPWMYRLAGSWDVPGNADRRPQGPSRFCFVEPGPDGTLLPCPDERFVQDGADLMVIPPPRLLDGPGRSELLWRPPFHWGGLLLERRLFEGVGGYCRRYVGWGCEDDDLLIKLAAGADVVRAWRAEPGISCLHFEHPRPYDTAEFAANRTLLGTRRKAGTTAMIKEDVDAGGRRARD